MYNVDMKIEGYLTVKEAAAELGISPGGVRQHLARGNIEGVKIGNSWLIPVDEIEKIRDVKPGPRPKDT